MSFLIIGLAIYKKLLSCIYYFIFSNHFQAVAFVQSDSPQLYSSVFSWVIFLLSLPFGIRLYKNESLSGNIFFMLYLVYFIPALCFWEFNPHPWQCIASQLLYFVMFALAIVFIPDFNHMQRRSSDYKSYYHSVLLIVSVIICSCFLATGSNLLLSLSGVYDIRYLGRLEQTPVIIRYLFYNSRCLLSLLFGIAVYRKSMLEAAFVLFLVLISFSIDGLKSVVFITLLTGCAIFIQWKNKHILSGFLAITAGGCLEYWVVDSVQIVDYLRRVIAIPAQLNYFFYDFFSEEYNQYDFFRQGLLGKLGFQSPYDISIYKIIGGEYYNNWEMLANNGLFSDAFFNLGYVGIIVMPFAVVLVIKSILGCASGLPKQILLGLAIMTTYFFITSSFFTLFFTHGIIATSLFLYFLPDLNKNKV